LPLFAISGHHFASGVDQVGNILSNYIKGRFVEKATLPLGTDNLVIDLLTTTALPSDATLKNCQFLSDVTTAGGVIAAFTNYARKVLAAVDITITVNTGTGVVTLDTADQVWSAAGGASNATLGKLLIAYRPTSGSANSAIALISCHDYTATTTGGNLTAAIPSVATAT
jgi:hypothetical protein